MDAILWELFQIDTVENELIQTLPQDTRNICIADFPVKVIGKDGFPFIMLIEFM